MDTSTSEISGQKKDPLEHLPREELLKKCRQFLAIAQKAKQAKDELNEEKNTLTSKLDEVQTKSEKDVTAMQEMLNVLTEHKLELVTKIDTFQKEKYEFKGKYDACQQDLEQARIQVQNVDTENQSFRRQVRRLTEENDQLISHLDTLEKRINELNEIGEQQREQLLLLEKQQTNSVQNIDEEVEELRLKCNTFETEISNTKLILTDKEKTIVNLKEEIDMLPIKNEQIVQLKSYCQLKNTDLECLQIKHQELIDLNNNLQLDSANKTESINFLKSKLSENELILTETKNEYDVLKIELIKTKQNYNETSKLFNKNIQQICTDVLQLKKYKHDVSLVLQSYKKYINTWKSDISQLIDKLVHKVANRDLEIEKLKLENNNLNQNINTSPNTEILVELNNLKEKLQQKDSKINSLVDGNEKLNITLQENTAQKSVLIDQLNTLELNINTLKTQLLDKNAKLDDLVNLKESDVIKQLNSFELNINILTEQISLLQTKYEELEKQILHHEEKCPRNILEMQNKIRIMNEENNHLRSALSEIQNYSEKCEELQNKNGILNEENNDLKSYLSEAENYCRMYEEMQNKNCILNEENINLKSSLSESQNNSKVYKEKVEELKNITEKYENELVEGIKKSQEEKILLLSKENNLLKQTISGGAKHLEILTANLSDKNTLESENLRLKSDLSDEKEKNSDLRTENTVARKLNMELQQTSTSLEEAILRNADFLKIIEGLRFQIENHYIGKKLFENASKSLTALNEKNASLKEKINKYEEDLTSYSRDCSDLRNQLSLSKRANAQLLEEMNEMNLALKERGETISKLQEIYQELQKQTKTLEQESQALCKEKGALEREVSALKQSQISAADREENKALVAEKQKIIQDLEGEIKLLKESLNTSIGRDTADGAYGENETMSTSTISRTEDVARMRDLEGSWEERYAKLRTLALKLKGKVKELTGQLAQERTEKNELQNKISSITKNLQSVQSEYDKLQDQFENLDKEYKKKTKQIENFNNEQHKSKIELNDSKETSSKLKLELEALLKEKMGSNTAVKQYTTQIQNLKKEHETSNEKIKDLTNKLSKLEGSICTKESDWQNEIRSHNNTKEKLQKIEKEIKKNSVLSLEMDDYERSLKDLSQKLEKKKETVIKLEQEIETLNATISSLKTQIKSLETETHSQELKCQGFQQQLSESQAKISSVEAAKAQKDNRIREVLQSYEDYKISSEERNCELSKTVTENQKQLEVFRTEKEHFKSIILGLEDKIRELTKISNDQGQELLHVKDEFSNYKVRAQSVLRQNQTRDVANEERLAEEVNELKIQIDSLTTQSNETILKLRTITTEYELINTEKTKIVSKFEEVEKLLIKEKENNKYLMERQQQLTTEHKEALRAQKVHLDTLTHCYKQQITEQEERHVKEMTELKAAQAHFTSQAVAKAHEDAIDIASIPREDGEGSESVGSNYAPFRTSVLSLDKLLNADVESSFDYDAELAHCKKKLVEYEAKIIHLTDLLADTEQDLAKHSQLNQHLKDEIRRHQRSVEREKHAENLEYLKNVVFKFLTLNNGDEKSHLVPVLNTILKLSPDETQKLNAVARGTDPTARGWGSYIPLWNSSTN